MASNQDKASNQDNLMRMTTSEELAGRLRREILRAELAPGARLRQGAIAARFGVSTTPVREAFALLQSEGLVQIDPHRGAIVFLPSIEDLQEYYEIRESLETLAITLAITNLEDELLVELEGLVAKMRDVEDEPSWAVMNEEFHRTLYAAAKRPRLANMISTLRDASSTYIHMYLSRQNRDERSNDDHQQILEACRARDAEQARAAVSHHLRHTASELATFIKAPEIADAD